MVWLFDCDQQDVVGVFVGVDVCVMGFGVCFFGVGVQVGVDVVGVDVQISELVVEFGGDFWVVFIGEWCDWIGGQVVDLFVIGSEWMIVMFVFQCVGDLCCDGLCCLVEVEFDVVVQDECEIDCLCYEQCECDQQCYLFCQVVWLGLD